MFSSLCHPSPIYIYIYIFCWISFFSFHRRPRHGWSQGHNEVHDMRTTKIQRCATLLWSHLGYKAVARLQPWILGVFCYIHAVFNNALFLGVVCCCGDNARWSTNGLLIKSFIANEVPLPSPVSNYKTWQQRIKRGNCLEIPTGQGFSNLKQPHFHPNYVVSACIVWYL